MKRVLWLTVLALALPLTAFADSVDFSNSGGILAGSNSGLSLTGSALIAVNGLNGLGLVLGKHLGSVSFSTGALTSGSLQMGGTFAAGGSFTITGNGSNGIPNGTIFTGTFSGPATWAMVNLANGTHSYTLTGVVAGTLGSGFHADLVTVQLTINTGRKHFNGRTHVSSGDTNVSTNVVVPEPGSLSLLGTGLLGLAGIIRRKLKVS
jgi:hypothetical protein